MADSSVALYEEEYSIEKRIDGTEDFHCIIPSCAGVFSYRTLRALNNHRTNTHKLQEIPRRKRGPKKSELSRTRCRSAEAIRKQVMKRATDISKREQGCRSMAKLRASRLAMAQAGGVVDSSRISTVINEVDKLLETWEGGSARRRSLLERRIQMARLEWTLKGEPLPLPGKEAELLTNGDGHKVHHIKDGEMKESERREGKEFQGYSIQKFGEGENKCHKLLEEQEVQTGCENSFVQQISSNAKDLERDDVTEMADSDCNSPEQQVHIQCEKVLVKELSEKVMCPEKDDAKQSWQRYTKKKCVSPNH